jgi:uncharacterized surface protein with fasciclin (FAS1) repeats
MKSIMVVIMSLLVLSIGVSDPVKASVASEEVGCISPTNLRSIVDVLELTGRHSTFLQLLQEHDMEGYVILMDPDLSDKTIWAPTDEAFASISSQLDALSSLEIKKILGYHISPPLSRPNGEYPIVTFSYIENNPNQVFRTRTGVLTESDQRISLSLREDGYHIEDSKLESTMWCAKAGSVFSITSVITDVEPPSTLTFIGYRLVRILFYEDIRFTIYATVAGVALGTAISIGIRKRRKTS